MNRRKKIQMPLTARDKSTKKILSGSCSNYKKELNKTISSSTILSFRNKNDLTGYNNLKFNNIT